MSQWLQDPSALALVLGLLGQAVISWSQTRSNARMLGDHERRLRDRETWGAGADKTLAAHEKRLDHLEGPTG